MSEKKRMGTWVPTIVMGVVAILFSVYALQEQTELQRARIELENLKTDLTGCQQGLATAEAQTEMAERKKEESLEAARLALAEAEAQYRRALKNEKSNKR
jgi:uncharacterized membrane protein YgaE (UPF0421/DUF939 family)